MNSFGPLFPRTSRATFYRAIAALFTLLSLNNAALARSAAYIPDHGPTGYAPVVLRAHVADRNGRPLAGLHVRFSGAITGQARGIDGLSEPCRISFTLRAVTGSDGTAVARVRPFGGGLPNEPWFRGRLSAAVTADDATREISLVEGSHTKAETDLPVAPGDGPGSGPSLEMRTFEEPDTNVDGFPIWAASDGSTRRIVVVLEGFDVYNAYSATDVMSLISGVSDVVRRFGIAVMVVNYPNSQESPDALAPLAERAILAAVHLSGQKVAVAGLSMGGLVGRWALVSAENRGTPLPVHTLLELDTPNRGANINPGLQAMILRYGSKSDRQGMECSAARHALFPPHSNPLAACWASAGEPLRPYLMDGRHKRARRFLRSAPGTERPTRLS